MENKINLVELLKYCPTGMELDCTMYNKVTLLNVDTDDTTIFPITIVRQDGNIIKLTKYGQYANVDFAKCIIFPKGKTTWEGFQIPFKDGDIIYIKCKYYDWCSIFNKCEDGKLYTYIDICITSNNIYCSRPNIVCECSDITEQRFATEEEKEKLFKAIKDNGYKWNEESKSLEKLPKFKVDDWVVQGCNILKIRYVGDEYYCFETVRGYVEDMLVSEIDSLYHLWTIQDAKDGDVLCSPSHHLIWIYKDNNNYYACVNMNYVTKKVTTNGLFIIPNDVRPATKDEQIILFEKIKENGYKWNAKTKTLEKLSESYKEETMNKAAFDSNTQCCDIMNSLIKEETSGKFDINTLVPFESRVLVRDYNCHEWVGEIFTRYADKSFNNCNFVTLGGCRWKQCIPYEGNEYLLDTTNDCNDYYKNWK